MDGAGDVFCTRASHGFRSARLTVQTATEADIPGLVSAMDDDDARAWQGWTHYTHADFVNDVRLRMSTDATVQELMAICLTHSGDVIGFRAVTPWGPTGCWIGTVIAKKHRHLGYGTEELRGTLAFLHKHEGYAKVCGATDLTNAPSRRQMRAAGMQEISMSPNSWPALADGRVPEAIGYLSEIKRRAGCRRRRPNLAGELAYRLHRS